MSRVIVILWFSCLAFASAGKCRYKIKDFKLVDCDSPCKFYEIKNLGIQLVDRCGVKITANVKALRDMASVRVHYSGGKGNMKVIEDEKDACNFEIFNFKVKCPIKKGTIYKSNKDWVYSHQYEGLMGSALGKLNGKSVVKIGKSGECCHKVTAELVRT